jgi:hypothetical protein
MLTTQLQYVVALLHCLEVLPAATCVLSSRRRSAVELRSHSGGHRRCAAV